VVLKHFVNSFRETELQSILDEQGIRDLVIVGSMSHMCIDGIARAADLGYGVTVIHDACACRDLEFNGVTVVPAAQVHAAFMSALVSLTPAWSRLRSFWGADPSRHTR
jgi:nicotinamidase-related amidase